MEKQLTELQEDNDLLRSQLENAVQLEEQLLTRLEENQGEDPL